MALTVRIVSFGIGGLSGKHWVSVGKQHRVYTRIDHCLILAQYSQLYSHLSIDRNFG